MLVVACAASAAITSLLLSAPGSSGAQSHAAAEIQAVPSGDCPFTFNLVQSGPCRKVGDGGEAEVYALQTSPPIAIKVLRAKKQVTFSPRLTAMKFFVGAHFEPYMTQLRYDGTLVDRNLTSRAYYALELAEGDVSKVKGDEFRKHSAKAVAHLLCGLGRIHAAGGVYGDVKAKNTLVFPDVDGRLAGEWTLKFSDLDNVCRPEPEPANSLPLCTVSRPSFTREYLAPEAWRRAIKKKGSFNFRNSTFAQGRARDMFALGWLIVRIAECGHAHRQTLKVAMAQAKSARDRYQRVESARSKAYMQEALAEVLELREAFDISQDPVCSQLPSPVLAVMQSLLNAEAEERGTVELQLAALGARCAE